MRLKTLSMILLFATFFHTPTAFSAQLTFTPRASAEGKYTDNLFLTDDDTEDDFVTTVSAGFALGLAGRTNGLDFTFDPNYAFYRDFDEFNDWGLQSDLKAWTTPSRSSRLELTNSFFRTTDPIRRQDPIAAEGGRVQETGDTTVRRGREPYYRNRARLDASYQFGRENRAYAGFLYGLLRNDDDQVQDNDEYRPSVGLDYWFSQQYGAEFFGEFTRGVFSQRSGFVGAPTSDFDNWLGTLRLRGRMTRHFSLFVQYDQAYRDFDNDTESDYVVYAPSAGFTYDFSEDMYLRLGLGYYWQDFKDEKNQEDPFINGEISKTWDFQRGSINLTGLSGITQNDFGAQDIGFEQFAAIQGSAQYNFTRRIAGDIGAYYRYGTQPPQTDDTDDDLTTNRYRATAGISYVPLRWMNIRLGYEFNKYSSSEGSLSDYTENRGLLTVTLQPDQPWRY